MNHKDFTVEQIIQKSDNVGHAEKIEVDAMVYEFLRVRPARDIELFFQKTNPYNNNTFWIDRAKVALDIRLAEDAAETTKKLIEHTEKLTKQTDTQIQNSATLSNQTALLITESQNLTRYTKGLYWLTAAVVVFTVVLVILGCIDYHDKHKEWVNPLFNGHQ